MGYLLGFIHQIADKHIIKKMTADENRYIRLLTVRAY